MEAGRLEIYTTTISSDGIGGFTTGSDTLSNTIWCKWSYLDASRVMEWGSITDKQPIQITVRSGNNITAASILKFQSKDVIIHSVVDNDFKQTLINGWV